MAVADVDREAVQVTALRTVVALAGIRRAGIKPTGSGRPPVGDQIVHFGGLSTSRNSNSACFWTKSEGNSRKL